MVDMQAKAILSAEDKASAVLAMVARNFDKLNKAADRLNRIEQGGAGARAMEQRATAMQRYGAAMSSVAGLAARVAPVATAAGAVALINKAARAYAEQERAMTRIAITGDATRAQQEGAALSVEQLADRTGLAMKDVRSGLDSLVASGRSLPEAMAFLPSVAKTAQASGAEVVDIARSADAVGNALGITADRMESAFDVMAAAGKAGKFELKDMARYMPSLSAQAAQLANMKGEQGLKQLVAMLQMIRAQSGTSEEAATNMANIFGKLDSDETRSKFKEMGVDSAKAMEKARKEGRNLVEVMAELVATATKGDLSKIPRLFQDTQVQKGLIALTSQTQGYKDLIGKLGNVSGTVDRDFQRVLADTQTGFDRAGQAAGRFVRNLGNLPVVKDALSAVADGVNKINDAMEKHEKVKRALAEAGIKPVPQLQTPEAAQADRLREMARLHSDPEYWASLQEMDSDEMARRRRPKDTRSPAQKAQDAFEEVQAARRRQKEDEEGVAQQERARVLRQKAEENADIERGDGKFGEGRQSAQESIAGQRAQGDTPAQVYQTLGKAEESLKLQVKRMADLEAYAKGDPTVLARKRASAPDSIRDDVERVENERRRLRGETTKISKPELDAMTASIVAAIKAEPEKYRTGEVPKAGEIKAEVKPDQITAKTEVNFTGGVNIQVNPGSELISLTTQMKSIIAKGGSNGATTNLTGQTNP